MKASFFLLKFPLSSETFVLNQITAFIDMGFWLRRCFWPQPKGH